MNNSKLLGSFLDTGTATISGCFNTCLLGLITKFFSKKITVFTQLSRLDNWGSNAAPNAVGYTLEQLSGERSAFRRKISEFISCIKPYLSK
jgi:hypothetical protein